MIERCPGARGGGAGRLTGIGMPGEVAVAEGFLAGDGVVAAPEATGATDAGAVLAALWLAAAGLAAAGLAF